MTLTFDTLGHTIDGMDMTLRLNQKTGLSKGGTRYAESFGPNKQVYQFSFLIPISSGSVSDRADVITFFDTILGAVEPFKFTDENSVALTVRCIDDQITFQTVQEAPQYCKCTLNLEVQS